MTSISTPPRGIGSTLDLGVAALAAVSVGFLAFAMPDELFSSLVGASHLPDLVAAAAPPLGMKARYAVIVAGAGLSFLLVWSLMRALEGAPEGQAPAKPVRKEPEADAPRLRRADAHPDAPARRPLIAREDLGEPEIDEYDLDIPAEPFPASAFRPESEPEPAPVATDGRLPRFMVTEEEVPFVDRDPIVPASRKKSVDPLAHRAGEIQESADSIGSLMHRLERGLADREEPVVQAVPQPPTEPDLPPPLAQASANPDVSLSPEGVRHRLRSAIKDLNQVASRG